MTNDELRIAVKELKLFQDISYTEIAEYLEIKQSSMFNWLKGQYDFSTKRMLALQEIITNLKE